MDNRISDDIDLRLLQLADAAELFALTDANRIYLRRWLPWLDIINQVDDTRNFIARTMKVLFAMLNGSTSNLATMISMLCLLKTGINHE